MKPNRREFIKSICVLAGGILLYDAKAQNSENNKPKVDVKKEKQCTSIYCRYNKEGRCVNELILKE